MSTVFTQQRINLPPCQAACPAGIRARDYVALVAQGRFLDAVALTRERMPLLAACGRVCYHPCEVECNRGLVDEPIAIMDLKRFISDYEFELSPTPPPARPPSQRKKVAVIGAGPCGLTAAQDLIGQGYPVSLFEAQEFPGGTVRMAIPRYRLPQERLDWDIHQVLSRGIELHTRAALGREFSLSELRQEGFAAVLIATGADRSRKRSRPHEGVFAEGDFVYGMLWTVDAVGAGHRAAQAVKDYLEGGSPSGNSLRIAKRAPENIDEMVRAGDIKLHPCPPMPLWDGYPPLGIAEIEKGFTEEMAIAEARRCLCCGSAEILPEKCVACLTCLRVCPWEVPAVTSERILTIREDRCQACAICAGECPVRAIAYTMPGAEDIPRQLDAVLGGAAGLPLIVGFFCSYGAYATTITEFSQSLPQGVLPISVPCLAKLDVTHFLRAFELGADAVVAAGCGDGDCAFDGGILWAERRAETARKVLLEMGLGEGRIVTYELPHAELQKLTQELEALIEKVKGLGANPGRQRRRSQ